MIYWPAKAPGAKLSYEFDWSDALAEGVTITAATVTATGVTVENSSHDDNTVTVELSEGALGTPGIVTCAITTSDVGSPNDVETAILLIGEEPISVAEAKAQVRMSNDDSEDAFIASLIMPARAYVERVTRCSFVPRQVEEAFSDWGDFLAIYRRPIVSVDTVAYVDADGNDAEYDGFLAPIGRFPLRIYPGVNDSFPALSAGGSITVTVTTGALDPTSEEFLMGKRAMFLLIGFWFDNREAFALGTVSPDVDFAIRSLMDELRPVSAY